MKHQGHSTITPSPADNVFLSPNTVEQLAHILHQHTHSHLTGQGSIKADAVIICTPLLGLAHHQEGHFLTPDLPDRLLFHKCTL